MLSRLWLATALCALSVSGLAHADYPDRPITMIVPFPPGGPTDAIARHVGQALGKELNTSIVIDNRGGAGGVLATNLAANAKPDGYTVFFATTGTMTINPALYKSSLKIDPLKAFTPVGTVASAANVLVVSKEAPYNSLQDLIDAIRANPNVLTFASSGNGGIIHLTGEQFKNMGRFQISHIPYKGSAPAMTDLMSQRVTMMFDVISGSIPLIQGGKLKALAVTSDKRLPILPDVPTMAEAGMPGFETTSWFGLVAPQGTPESALSKLHDVLQHILASPGFKSQLQALGVEPMPGSRKDFDEQIQKDTSKWADLVRKSGATVD
ncbi:LacI family transcriptional regulator [Bordetella genomosp. 8]|uniref:LacI family transcriptional regulator n=1 Tax=Bordetella genomosp. 8 TaxID=1416806 RepID=A0A1W6YPP3_9BORD|nr:tripartite tricarboxylate transporter substrate binding protein [Bordetella genomosp. 8]ARP82964.1 LacI family transcriptional regulator [Bordetella genomosp. 8]